MKKLVLFAHLILISANVHPQHRNGELLNHDDGSFTIRYPGQHIHISFDHQTSILTYNYLIKADLSIKEKNIMAQTIKSQFDHLPTTLGSIMGDLHIRPIHIGKKDVFSFQRDNTIFIESDWIIPGFSYKQSIKTALLYEIGIWVLNYFTGSPGLNAYLSYLSNFHSHLRELPPISYQDHMFSSGFISYRSLGEWNYGYRPEVEFGEIFAYLICEESKEDVLRYVNENPESVLANKVTQMAELLASGNLGFSRESLLGKMQYISTSPPPNPIEDRGLLALHEMKSYQVYNVLMPEIAEPVPGTLSASSNTVTRYSDSKPITRYETITPSEAIISTESSHHFTGYVTPSGNYHNAQKKKGNGWLWMVFVLAGLLAL